MMSEEVEARARALEIAMRLTGNSSMPLPKLIRLADIIANYLINGDRPQEAVKASA